MFYSAELMREIESLDPKMRDILYKLMSEIENRYSLSEDVKELKEIVKQISIKVDTWVEKSQQQYEKLLQLHLESGERINNIIKTQEQHSKEIAELREIVKQNSQAIQQHSKEIAELREIVRQNSKDIAELKEVVKQHSKEITELREIVKQNSEAIQQHSKEISELREIVRQNSKDIAELKEVVKQHSKEIAELREIVKQNSKDIAELREVVKQHSKEIAELREIVRQNSKDIAELKEVVKQHSKEIAELKETVKQLVKTQEQHSKEIAELREIVKQNSKDIAELKEVVSKLIEEHKQTRAKLDKLIEDHEETRSQLGGLSHTVGYFLEDRSYIYLPELLKRDFGIEVVGELYRDYIEIGKNKYVEVNILGKAVKDGKEIYIVGEAKTQAKKKDIDAIVEMAKKLEKAIPQEKFMVLVTYQASPQVREYAKQKNIKIYFSYQFR